MVQVDQATTIGSQVSLRTQEGEDVSGVIFGCAFDGPQKVIIIQQPGSTPFHNNLRIIKENSIASISDYVLPSGKPLEPLPPVDEKRSREREEKAVRAAELEAAKIGVGVTEEGQAVFDSLAKTLPCKWNDKTIVVLDEVFIGAPYAPENCKSLHSDDTATLDRVVKILESEKQKTASASN